MKYMLCIAAFLVLNSARPQSKPDDQVRSVIETLFKGMKLGDSAMVHSAFSAGATFVSMGKDKQGKSVKRNEALADFLKAVGTPHTDVWNEEIWGVKIQIDGDFAQAWCDYGFFVNDTFSHCGVDAFHLYNDGAGWKIFHLADTRRKEPCKIPSDIQKKHPKK